MSQGDTALSTVRTVGEMLVLGGDHIGGTWGSCHGSVWQFPVTHTPALHPVLTTARWKHVATESQGHLSVTAPPKADHF